MGRDSAIENIRQNYESLAQSYDQRWQNFHCAAHDWILQRLNSPATILDLGCGTGLLLSKIAAQHPQAQLSGIDICPAMLAQARKRDGKISLAEEDINSFSSAQSYDAVLSINVLHHLNDVHTHLESLKPFCQKEGCIFLCDFAIDTLSLYCAEYYWRAFHPAHHKAYSSKELNKTLRQNFIILERAILKPDRFWRLQIYKLGLQQNH